MPSKVSTALSSCAIPSNRGGVSKPRVLPPPPHQDTPNPNPSGKSAPPLPPKPKTKCSHADGKEQKGRKAKLLGVSLIGTLKLYYMYMHVHVYVTFVSCQVGYFSLSLSF